jgi:hypothetical protein
MEQQSLLPAVSRRGFLKALGAGTVVVVADARNLFDTNVFAALQDLDGTLVTRLIRPEDQLRVRFEFINLVHDVANDRLVAGPSGTPLMRLTIGRQHLTERPLAAGVVPPAAFSTLPPHRVASASRLVFAVSPPLALTVPVLLDLARHALVTSSGTGDPGSLETMIELPADLRLSPGSDVEMTADVAPITFASVSQLHRIVLSAPGAIEMTPVHNASAVDGFAGRVPNTADRTQIVARAAAEGSAVAERMWLTPHGAWADLSGEWSTISWHQKVTSGRDQFAQVVEAGVLMPFGVPAVWTQTSTRLWLVDAGGRIVATMVTEQHFAVVGAPTVTFPGPHSPFGGRDMPFRSVTIEHADSLAATKGQITWTGGSLSTDDAWFVNYPDVAGGPVWGGSTLRMSYSATDRADNAPVTFSLPALFVRAEALDDVSVGDGLVDFLSSGEAESLRSIAMRSDVAWADEQDQGSGATTLFTRRMEFGLRRITGVSSADLAVAGQRRVVPFVTAGEVTKTELNGQEPTPEQLEIDVVFSGEYLQAASNPTSAFLDLVTPAVFPLGAAARAVMTPELRAEQFNQTTGIGPAVETDWSPAAAFGADASILRGVKLADLVPPIRFDLARPGIDIPTFDAVTLPDQIVHTYRWCPESISSVPLAGFVTTAATSLCVEVTTVISLAETVDASATVVFEVQDFTLVIPPGVSLIQLDINSMKATETSSGNTDLEFDIGQWRLGGALSWLEPLISKLSPRGSEFDVDIDVSAIVADLEVSLPSINLGVLAIRNFTIGLTGTFPFIGSEQPTIGVGVGSRRAPVSLQILQFRGGFWCEMEFSSQGLELLHIHADATAMLVEIDIKVAEAYCYVTVGADFTLKNGNVTFTGYVSLSAGFSVLGLVGATLEIVGRVTYQEAAELITVSGTIYWSVTALFTFRGRVPLGELSFRTGDGASAGFARPTRALMGQATSPEPSAGGSFGDAYDLDSWREYVAKFAPEPA